jgi:integrase/recombinase XerD
MNYSPRTIDDFYQNEFKAFRRYLDANQLDPTPADITTELIRDFLANRQLTRSSVTARHSWQVLSVWFKFLFAEGVIDSNPMQRIEKPKTRKIAMKTYSTAQVEAMLADCNIKTFIGARDNAMILLFCDCGLRVSELISLQVADVDTVERVITVTTAKCNKMRIVPYGEAAARALRQYLTKCIEIKNQRPLFISCYGEQLLRRHVLTIVKQHGKNAGIPASQCGVHMFRRFFAVQFLRNGGDVFTLQKILGHSTLEMTRKYAEMAQTDVISQHRAFSPADRLNNPNHQAGRKRLR